MFPKVERRGIFARTAVLAVLVSAAPVSGAHAGSSNSINVDGKTLEFEWDDPSPGENVDVVDLPFVYSDILPELDNGCLQARIDRNVRENVDVNDVDENPSVGINFDLEANPDVSPIEIRALAEFSLEFFFDADCDTSSDNAVPTSVRNVCVHVRDIDDHQFLGFAFPTSYTLTADSNLDVDNRNGYTTAFEPLGEASEFVDEPNWAQFEFSDVERIRWIIGVDPGGDDDAEFALNFFCPEWSTATVQRSPYSLPTPDLDRYSELAETEQPSLPNTR